MQIHDCSPFLYGPGTPIKSGGAKLVYGPEPPLLFSSHRTNKVKRFESQII